MMRKLGAAITAAAALSACLSSANLSGSGDGTCAADLQNDVGNCGACGKVCGNKANAYGYCKAGACAIGCNTGFGDCDGKPETGCESTLATDSNHCGACGKSCGGARCVAGECQPIAIAEIPGSVTAIAQDATDLYYGFSGGGGNYAVGKLAKDGSKGHTAVVTGITYNIPSLAVTDTQVYWTKANAAPTTQPADGAIYRAAKTASSTPDAAWIGALRMDSQDTFVIADGIAFYVTTDPAPPPAPPVSTVWRAALAATAGTPMAQEIRGSVQALAVDGGTAYFFARGDGAGVGRGIYRCATSGCGTAIVPVPGTPANTNVNDIVANGPHLYLSTGSAVARQKKDGTEYAVLGVGDARYPNVRGFATDGTRLYWTEEGDGKYSTWSCPVANCKDGRLPVVVPGEPRWALVDDKSFYIVTKTSEGASTTTTVMKVVK